VFLCDILSNNKHHLMLLMFDVKNKCIRMVLMSY
jgi:hypothetical protein